ncbi:unnamed protein product, partial [Ectocarpus sp. 13 AM-2016]
AESQQPQQSLEKQQPAASPAPSTTAGHVDENRPAAPSTAVGVWGIASATAAAVVCDTSRRQRQERRKQQRWSRGGPVASSRRVDSSGLKRWSHSRCLGTRGSQGACAQAGGGGGGGGGRVCSSGGDDGICGFDKGAPYPFDPRGLLNQ